MKIENVRITNITIKNFKNVINGSLALDNSKKNYKASILGLYGQNGSGKTAIINVIELLQYLLCGRSVPSYFAEYININSNTASIAFEFNVNGLFLSYHCDITTVPDDTEQNTEVPFQYEKKIRIFNEVLKCSTFPDKQQRIGTLIDTGGNDIFAPKTKLTLLTGKFDKDTDLIVAKKMTYMSSRSFIFSRELLTAIRTQNKINPNPELIFYSSIIESIVYFGNHCLFIINTANSGLISLNTQPFVFKHNANKGTIILPLNFPTFIPFSQKVIVEKIIKSMNIVLQQLIPGLTIGIKDLGTQTADNGEIESKIQLMSRNGKIPLKNEAEGIKKIISVLQLLIVVYNQPSITVAIDELDAGIFEYLLGEILRIISEKGKGQLIFTSHNLHPLETINKNFIAFTTTYNKP